MSERSGSNGAGGVLSERESVELSGHLAGMARAGLPMASGLAALAEEMPPGRLRRSMNELVAQLESGMPLDKAVEEQEGRIPPHFRGLVIAGARTQRLGDVLSQFSAYVGIGAELRRRVWLTMAYPLLSMGIAVLLFTLVSTTLVPQFESLYRDFGVPLPRVTVAILEVSRVMATLGPPLLLIAVGLVILGMAAPAFVQPGTVRGLVAGVPIIGGLWRWTSLAEFCQLLALLLENHVPLPQALRLTGEGVQDSGVARACSRMAESVESGRSLALAMADRRLFPSGFPRLVHWGSRQGGLAEVLRMAAAMFEARAAAHAYFAGTVLSVLSVCMVLWGVLTVVLGLMFPLVNLISRLAG